MLNGAESQIARTPKFEFIINPCSTECRAVADGDRTPERIIFFRCQSSVACSVEIRELKFLNAEIIIFLSRAERVSLSDFAKVVPRNSFVLFVPLCSCMYTISASEFRNHINISKIF